MLSQSKSSSYIFVDVVCESAEALEQACLLAEQELSSILSYWKSNVYLKCIRIVGRVVLERKITAVIKKSCGTSR